MSATLPPTPPGAPDNDDLERFLERVPADHRAALRTAVEQWSCAMWLAANATDGSQGVAETAVGADLAAAPVLRIYESLIETMAGRSIVAPRAPVSGPSQTELACAFGELAGTLARLAGEAVATLELDSAHTTDTNSLVRKLYDDYVESWEARYRDWMLSDDFARLQGTLCNGALSLRAASRAGAGDGP